jgi:hypothetical protein
MMDVGQVVVVVVTGLGLAVGWWFRKDPTEVAREQVGTPDDAGWEAVKQLRLSVPNDRYWPATGKVDGIRVELEVSSLSAEVGARRHLAVRLYPTVPASLRLRLESTHWVGGEELVVGETRFDDLFHVSTQNELETRALFDQPTREALAAAGALGADFTDGRWWLRAESTTWSADQIVKAVRALVRAHHALRKRLDVVREAPAAALNRIAAEDRTAGVRLRALEHLLRAGRAERDVLRGRTEDVDVNVRLLAAHALGVDGHAVLERLARTGSRSVRVRAATHLAASNLLAPALATLVEDVFLVALDDPELVKSALLGLTRRGTARAVVPLRELAEGTRRVGDSGPSAEVRRLAEGVLTAVRARLDPSASGAVSLPERDQGGEVSLAAPGRGDVAFADPE